MKNNVIKLLTTDLHQHNYIKDVYCETNLNKTSILRIARCINRYLFDGKIVRDCNPILNVLNSNTAQILEFKN